MHIIIFYFVKEFCFSCENKKIENSYMISKKHLYYILCHHYRISLKLTLTKKNTKQEIKIKIICHLNN